MEYKEVIQQLGGATKKIIDAYMNPLKAIIRRLVQINLLVMAALICLKAKAYAYTSLISAGDFTAIETDVTTAATGIITIAIIILGAALLISALRR